MAAKKIDKWEPVGEHDSISPSEAVLEMARTLNERLQLTDGMMEEVAREVIKELALEPPRSVLVREAVNKDKQGRKSVFKFENTYADAVAATSSGLIPLAAKLIDLQPEDVIPDPSFSAQLISLCHTKALLVLTTSFDDPELEGKWGWASIPAETRTAVGEAILEWCGSGAWAYLSQSWWNGTEEV